MYLGSKLYVEVADISTAILREAWATLPESSSRPLPATLAQSRNLAHASLGTAVLESGQLSAKWEEAWHVRCLSQSRASPLPT